ncbi:MAG: hypothetical protein Q8P01_00755 [bacterium]|nr:hypothetical protein [bacterium]
MTNLRNLILLIAVSVVFLVVGLAVGGYFGRIAGHNAARAELQALLNLAYPPPPDVLYRLSGTVESVVGGTINLSVNDPDDYLPHVDGAPRQTERRQANVRGATKYALVDYSKPDELGNPTETSFKLADLKAGDTIVVESEENIRDKKVFEVIRVEQVKF